MKKTISVMLSYILTFALVLSIFPVNTYATTEGISTWEQLKEALESGETEIYLDEDEPIVATSDIEVTLKKGQNVRVYSADGKDIISMDYTNYGIHVYGEGQITFENIPFVNYANPCIVNEESESVDIFLKNCVFFDGDGEQVKGNYTVQTVELPKKEIQSVSKNRVLAPVPMGISNVSEYHYPDDFLYCNVTDHRIPTFLSVEHDSSFFSGDDVVLNITMDDRNMTGSVDMEIYSIKDSVLFEETIEMLAEEALANVMYNEIPTISLYEGNLSYEEMGIDSLIERYNVPLTDGKGNVTVPRVSGGNYCAIATYAGDESHAPSQSFSFLEIEKYQTNIALEMEDFYYGEPGVINVTVNSENVTGNVTIEVYNDDNFYYDEERHKVYNGTMEESYEGELVDGVSHVEIEGLSIGDHFIRAVYLGDDLHWGSDFVTNLTVNKGNTTIIIDQPDGCLGTEEDGFNIIATTAENATGNFTFKMGGDVICTPGIKDGKAEISAIGFPEGIYNASIIYDGDDNYNSASIEFPVQIIRKIFKGLAVDAKECLEYGENQTIGINLTNLNVSYGGYMYDVDGNASVAVNIKNVTTNDTVFQQSVRPIDGRAYVEISELPVGNYFLDVDYSGNKYNHNASVSNALTIVKAKPELNITAENIPEEDVVLVNIDAADKRGKLINGNIAIEVFNYNGSFSENRTVEAVEGLAQIPLENLSADNYTVQAQFIEDARYTKSNVVQANFTVTGGEESSTEPTTEENTTTPVTEEPTTQKNVETSTAQVIDNEKDVKGSKYHVLQLKQKKVGKKSIKIRWKKLKGAKKYVVYYSKCGRTRKCKKLAETKKTAYTLKKLKKGTYYKFVVIALNKKGKVLSISKMAHIATLGGKNGNANKVTVNKNKVTLTKGKKIKLKGKAISASKKIRIKEHRTVRYESDNKKIATVTKKGVIRGKAKGTCHIYVYVQNGFSKKVKVTVK